MNENNIERNNGLADDETLRNAWQDLSRRLEKQEQITSRLAAGIGDNKRNTALESLAQRYQKFSILGLLFMAISIVYGFSHIFPPEWRLWIMTAMILYFGICSTMDFWLYRGIKSIDVYTMTVKEVMEAAIYYRRKHHQFMIILIPLAICLIGLFALAMGGESYALAGIACGAIIGIVLGLRQYMKFMDSYRSLTGKH